VPVVARRIGKGGVVAILAGASSAALFAIYFMWWWSLPDLMWQLALGLALLAVAVGLVARGAGGLVGALLGALVLAYFVLLIYSLGSD
jgi:hypothetical protein